MIKQKINSLIQDKTKWNFFIYGIGQSFNLLSPLIVAPLLVSKCGIDSFGKIGLGFALALFLILIVDYSFDVKGTKQVAENREENEKLSKMLSLAIFTKMSLFIIASLIGLLLIFFIPFFYQEKKLFIFSLLIVLAQVFNPVWFLQGIEKYKQISIINIASKSVYVLWIFLFIKEKNDYVWANFYLGLSALLINLAGLTYIVRKRQLTIAIPIKKDVLAVLKSDFTFCLSQLFLSVRQLSPLVITGYFLGYTFAGHFKVIEQVITLFRTFNQVYLRFFYPKACYLFATNKSMGFRFWKKYLRTNLFFVIIGLTILLLFSKEVLQFFHLSQQAIVGINPIFKASLLVSLMLSLTLSLEQLMFITDQLNNYIRITIFVTVINLMMLILLIKSYELIGVVFTLLIAELLFIILYFYNSFLRIQKQT